MKPLGRNNAIYQQITRVRLARGKTDKHIANYQHKIMSCENRRLLTGGFFFILSIKPIYVCRKRQIVVFTLYLWHTYVHTPVQNTPPFLTNKITTSFLCY